MILKNVVPLGAFGEVRRAIEDELAEALRMQEHWNERVEECQESLKSVDQVCSIINRLPGRIISRFNQTADRMTQPTPQPAAPTLVESSSRPGWLGRIKANPDNEKKVMEAVIAGFKTTGEIASISGIGYQSSYVALRALEADGLVARRREAVGRGVPKNVWCVAEKAKSKGVAA